MPINANESGQWETYIFLELNTISNYDRAFPITFRIVNELKLKHTFTTTFP